MTTARGGDVHGEMSRDDWEGVRRRCLGRDGSFLIDKLPPVRYRVSVEKMGAGDGEWIELAGER